jgi:hypothetical protein
LQVTKTTPDRDTFPAVFLGDVPGVFLGDVPGVFLSTVWGRFPGELLGVFPRNVAGNPSRGLREGKATLDASERQG